jgi:hypothetical protein
MSERKYSGDPIDMSWQTPPWQNDGETLDAYTSEGEGELTTDNWPENATDPEKLNDKQKKMILTAANHPDVNSPSKLVELSGLDVASNYPNVIIKKHWQERYWADGDREGLNDIDIDVGTLRQRLLNGESTNDLVKEYSIGQARLSSIARGGGDVEPECEIPPLEWLGGSEQRWAVAEENGCTSNSEDYTSAGDIDVPIDELRERALNGETAVEIAESIGVSSAPIRKRLKGQLYTESDCDIPPLEHLTGRGWYIPDTNGSDVQDDAEDESSSITSDEQHGQTTMPDKQRERQTVPRWIWAALFVAIAWLVSKLLK